MKIKLLLLSVFVCISYSLCAFPVILHQKPDVEGTPLTPIKKRTPQAPIVMEQNSRTLLFSTSLVGTIVSLYMNDDMVYFTSIDENGIVELPAELCGEYELRVYVGDAVYSANIEI